MSRHVFLTIAVRTVINTALRLVYPFLPALARGVGVEPAVLAHVVALRGLSGASSPLFGGLSDRHGRKPVLVAATAVFAAACLLPVARPGLALLGASLIAVGIAKSAFDPAFHGLLADEVPYARRGLAVGLSETSWAIALLAGAPAVAVLLAGPDVDWPWLGVRPAWTTPFAALGLAGVVGAAAMALCLPSRRPPSASHPAPGTTWWSAPRAVFQLLAVHASVRGAAAFCLLATAATEAVLIALGPWLEAVHAFSLGGLGLAAMLIGGAELLGELVTGPLVDRFGKRRVVLTAAITGAALFAALPWSGTSLAATVALIAAIFVAFETYIVGAIPLFTELVPDQRASVLSLTVASMSLGRGAGALAGAALWSLGGLAAVSTAAALLTFAAAAAMAASMAEPGAGEAV